MISYLAVVREAVALYPPGLLDKVGVERFVFVADLQREGRPIGGTAHRATGSIYIGVRRHKKKRELTIHHEVMHFIDPAMSPRPDREWADLNLPGTLYGGLHTRAPGALDLGSEHPGFLTHYAQKSIGEDKAELFKWLVVYPEVVQELVADDEVLASKVELLVRRLEALDAGLDELWWSEVWAEQSSRTAGYRSR